jgi:hypothetical protein
MTGKTTGRSFIIGYGPNQPKRPHHRGAACAFNYKAPCKLGPIGPNADVDGRNGTCCAGEGGEWHMAAVCAGGHHQLVNVCLYWWQVLLLGVNL